MAELDRRYGFGRHSSEAARAHGEPVPGKQTLTAGLAVQRIEAHTAPRTDERAAGTTSALAADLDRPRPTLQQLFSSPGVQCKIAPDVRAADVAPERVRSLASEGTAGAGGPLPHLDAIQRSFGRHDASGIRAHTDHAAAASATAMGAAAFATGNSVAFAGAPDLHTAAHEAAHVIQQRGGVQLQAHVGQAGDAHERHADEVADHVVQGRSAEALLDRYASAGPPSSAVQRIIRTKGGEPFKSFSSVKGQLTKEDIELTGPQLRKLEEIFKDKDTDLSLPEAVERVRSEKPAPKKRKKKSESSSSEDSEGGEQETPKKEKEKEKNKKRKTTPSKKTKTKDKSTDSRSESPSESDDDTGKTVGEMVLKALDALGITDRGLRCLLVDPAISAFAEYVKLVPESTDTVGEGSVNSPVQLGDDGLRRGWLAYTACYNTAVELVDMLKSGKQGALIGSPKTAIAKLSERKAEETLVATIGGLCQAIRDSRDGRRIFRIHYGIHGFAILVRDGNAELLESFAGTSGHSFLKGLEDHPVYSITDICRYLTNMVSSDQRKSSVAQRTLFGGSVEDDSNVWPKIELLWSESQLITDKQIVTKFTQMLSRRIKILG